MSDNAVTVVLAHGAWADGSSWSKVIAPRGHGVKSVAAPLPLTSLADDVAALDRTLERVDGPVVLVGHAYAGAVIAGDPRARRSSRWSMSPRWRPTKAKRSPTCSIAPTPHPKAPKLAPDRHGLIWLPEDAFAAAFAQHATTEEHAVLAAVQRPIAPACISVKVGRGRCGRTGRAGSSSPSRTA